MLVEEAVSSVRLDGETQVIGGQEFPQVPHLHRPANPPVVLSERYQGGRRYVVYGCVVCGEGLRERQG